MGRQFVIRELGCTQCGKPVLARGLCRNHYTKLMRTGTMERFRERRQGWSRSDWHRYSRYGITPEEYKAQLHRQEGVCAICREPFRGTKDTQQDHNHVTGDARGILCMACNGVIGGLERKQIPASFYQDYLDDWDFYAEDGEETA